MTIDKGRNVDRLVNLELHLIFLFDQLSLVYVRRVRFCPESSGCPTGKGKLVKVKYDEMTRSVVLNMGSIEPHGFGESVSGI